MGGAVTLSQTERNLPTIANVDARDFRALACWLIVQIGPISLNVTTPLSAFLGFIDRHFGKRILAITIHYR
jgi:hypothetical protein